MKEHARPEDAWSRLEGKIAIDVLRAPKTGGNPHGDWSPVHQGTVNYLEKYVVGKPWADHLALIAAVLTARRYDVRSVWVVVNMLHVRLSELFQVLDLKTIDEWDAERFIPAYLKGELLPQARQATRTAFWNKYSNATKQVWLWLEALPASEKQAYRQFTLPVVNSVLVAGLAKHMEVMREQRQKRKNESDGVVPRFAELRAEAHFRYNKLLRLYRAYHAALRKCQQEYHSLPYEFSYEEGDPPLERLHFKLWDRRSFVLAPEHAMLYGESTCEHAKTGTYHFTNEHNGFFLEFVKAERLTDTAPPEGFWFCEALKQELSHEGVARNTHKEPTVDQESTNELGGTGEEALPRIYLPSALCPPQESGTKLFLATAQTKTKGVLLPVECLYLTALFGLVSLDVFTTTGMRMNELLQIRLSKDCIVRLEDSPPPESIDQSPRIRYLFRLIPKGERTDKAHNFFVGKETLRLVEKVGQMLQEHYAVQGKETLPAVPFNPSNGRAHRFDPAPYLFQYNHQHLANDVITTSMRFLLYGMRFQTREGKEIVLKAHLLRHAFATFAVQVEQIPVDIVAAWLKQKELEVTRYYSQATESMVAEEHDSLLAKIATHIDVRKAVLRSPEEIRKLTEEAKRTVGTLVPVTGGDCTYHAHCFAQFKCIGCPAKAPDPEKRYQVEQMIRWAVEKLSFCQEQGLVLEAERMKQLIRDCELELKEMDAIVAYRKDEKVVPLIQVKSRERR